MGWLTTGLCTGEAGLQPEWGWCACPDDPPTASVTVEYAARRARSGYSATGSRPLGEEDGEERVSPPVRGRAEKKRESCSFRSLQEYVTMLRLVALLVMPMLIVAQYSQTAEQVWTAFGSTPDVLLITWTSNTSEGGVRYRINGGNYSEPADYAIVENYALPPAYARGGIPTPALSGLIHRQVISGLPLATYINYSIGSDALGWTADRTV